MHASHYIRNQLTIFLFLQIKDETDKTKIEIKFKKLRTSNLGYMC